jgi:hypothetical protein
MVPVADSRAMISAMARTAQVVGWPRFIVQLAPPTRWCTNRAGSVRLA